MFRRTENGTAEDKVKLKKIAADRADFFCCILLKVSKEAGRVKFNIIMIIYP